MKNASASKTLFPLLSTSCGLALVGLVLLALSPYPALGRTATLDGQGEAAYGPALAADPIGDLQVGSWQGISWTDSISLYVANDTRNLYVFTPLPTYSHTQSSGSFGLVIATGQYTATGGIAPRDPWENAITFAYTATHANVGATPVALPYRIVPDFILRGNIVGRDCCASIDNGWTELRRWNGSDYGTGGGVNWGGLSGGAMASQRIAFADYMGVEFSIPLADLGLSYVPGTPIHLQFFGTQTAATKGAYDTVPPDDQSTGWDDPTTQHFLSTYILTVSQDVAIDAPAEGAHFTQPLITVTGHVTPTGQVTLTLSVNGAHVFTPSLDSLGRFTQPVTLSVGANTLTATATSALGIGYDVRHVTYGAASHDGDIWWGCLGHFTRDPDYRDPGGALATAATVTLRLRACLGDLTGATLHVYLHNQGEVATLPMTISTAVADDSYDYWEAVATAPITPTYMYYKFEAVDGADHDWYVDDQAYDGLNGWGHVVDDNPTYEAFRITIYSPGFHTPDWMKEAVIYQIFPDRFRDGEPANNVISGAHFFYGNASGGLTYPTWNSPVLDPRNPASPYYDRYSEDFYGGDLQGVTEKLDYLDSLGVTVIYLNPIFFSPSNHKYDTTDYGRVDPRMGGNEAFGELVAAAQARGMRVILDGVFNHTSSDSIYFDKYSRWDANGNPTPAGSDDDSGAYESTVSPYYDWYTFSAWPDDYESWAGYKTLPKLHSVNPEIRTYIYSGTNPIAARWVVSGAAGWRLDVGGDVDGGASALGGNDYWEGFRQAVKAASSDAVIIGEEWGDASPWLLGQEWDSVMNYRFRSALLSFMRDTPYTDNDNNTASSGGVLNPITVSRFDQWLRRIQEDYAPEAWQAMMNLVGSHDTNRVRFVLGEAQHGDGSDLTASELDARQRLMALLQFTLPGAPTVYYGDEVGLDAPGQWYGGKWEDDPYNRAPFPWDDTPGPYQARPAIQAYYAHLARLRADHPALRTGAWDTLLTDDANKLYVYGRKWISGTLDDLAIVVVNRDAAPHTATVSLDGHLPAGAILRDVLHGGGPYTVSASEEISVDVEGMDGRILAPAPSLEIGKKVTAPPGRTSAGGVWPGAEVTYTIALSNTGGGPATGVVMTDALPAGVAFGGWLQRPADAVVAGNALVWTGTVTGGAALRFVFTATVSGDYGQAVTNTASYRYLTDVGSSAARFDISGPPVLSLAKHVTPTSGVRPGGVVTYTIVLTNSGDSPAAGAVLTDVLPAGLTFGAWVQSGGAIQVGNAITWTGTVSERSGMTMVLTAVVEADLGLYGQVITNTAYLRSSGAGGSQDSAAFRLIGPPNLSGSTKTVNTTQARVGELVTYTLTLANTGEAEAAVRYTDTLPVELEWVSGQLTGTVTVAAGHAETIVITARVRPGIGQSAAFSNTAVIDDGYHPAFAIHSAAINVALFRIYLPLAMH